MSNKPQEAFPVYNQGGYIPPVYTFQAPEPVGVELTNMENHQTSSRSEESSSSSSSASNRDDSSKANKTFVISEEYLNMDFDACFYEHKSTHTIPQVYTLYGYVYKYTKLIIYNVLVVIFGIPLALLWAMLFSILQFILTWLWNPSLKLTLLMVGVTMPAVTEPLKALFGPLVDINARIFRQIRIHISGNTAKTLAQTA